MKVTQAFILAVVVLVGGLGMKYILHQAERLVSNKAFSEFPLVLADRWKGRELGLEDRVLDKLKLSDYMMRVYVPHIPQGGEESELTDSQTLSVKNTPKLPVYLFTSFYQSQRTGATYHSPKNCLPGAGWQFVESEDFSLSMPGDVSITINKVLIQKGLEKQVILYWYHDRGRVIASEYWAKGYLVWDAMTKNRSDGSLVRISVPVKHATVDQALDHGVEFLRDMWPTLLEHMPDSSII